MWSHKKIERRNSTQLKILTEISRPVSDSKLICKFFPISFRSYKYSSASCWRLEGNWREEQDPDPLVTSTDPRIRIRSRVSTKMSRIPTTASNRKLFLNKNLGNQCSGSMTFWSGSGSTDPCLWLMIVDPDPAFFVIDLQDANKKQFFVYTFFLLITFWRYIYIIFQR